MANVKLSQEPPDSTPAASDYLLGNKASGGPTTQTFLLSVLATFFWTLANIPTGATSPITRDNESQFAFVASGLVWSGDSYNVNHNASMTAGVVYINGRRISISAVTARTFTISKDTYVDILDNGDGTGTLVYTEVANNAASPVLAANSIRIAIIVTSATVIVNSGSVNQGQETMILPIASSIAYSVTDSLGNLICTRDPAHRTLGYRQILTTFTTASTSAVQVTGLSCPVIVPTGRKIKITIDTDITNSTANAGNVTTWDGVVASGTQLQQSRGDPYVATAQLPASRYVITTPAAVSKTYNAGMHVPGGTGSFIAAANEPGSILVELA